MNLTFWIQIAVYIIGGFVFVAINAFVVGSFVSKLATKEELEKAKLEGDEKRRRIYDRFDEYKAHLETNFVRRDMCNLMHNETAKAVQRLSEELASVKKEISEIKDIVIQLQAEKA